MGRAGKMYAFQNFGVEPDVFALARGIASGMPLGAMVARRKIMNWGPEIGRGLSILDEVLTELER
jgi:4-aminobutyrate aminotransferase